MSAAAVSSRRVSAGVVPEPGATSRRPAWWSAEDFLTDVADAVTGTGRDVCREHHADPDTVLAVARGMAAYADHRTGRDCRPTNARLVEVCQVSLSTVQRARRVLKALGLCVELVRGRQYMTRAERLAAWRRGSSHRQVAAVFALCSRRARGAKTRTRNVSGQDRFGGAPASVVERDTPPGAPEGSLSTHVTSTRLRATTEQRRGRFAPAHTEGRQPVGRRRAADPATRRLAEAVRGRLGWLAGVHPSRMVPTLTRFARAGWTPRDVDLAVSGVLTARRWRVPGQLAQPAAYLAALLRDVDPGDRPTAVEDEMRAMARREDAYRLQLATGAPCPHGRPAGNVPSPLRGLMACPACRAAAEPAGW